MKAEDAYDQFMGLLVATNETIHIPVEEFEEQWKQAQEGAYSPPQGLVYFTFDELSEEGSQDGNDPVH